MPSDTEALTDDEINRATVIRIAKWYGLAPRDVRTWPYADVLDTLQVMEADNQIADIERQRAEAKAKMR